MPKPSANNGASAEPAAPIEQMSYEQALAELEAIIDRIESGEVGLEDSVRQYERGVSLRKHCEAILSRAEQRVVELTPPPDVDRGRA